jgi:hypothetical protein
MDARQVQVIVATNAFEWYHRTVKIITFNYLKHRKLLPRQDVQAEMMKKHLRSFACPSDRIKQRTNL